MPRDYAAVPYEYLEEMELLSDAAFGRLIRALLKYSSTGEDTELTGNEKFFRQRVQNREQRFQEAFEAEKERRTERAKAAANARWSKAKNTCVCRSITSNAQNAYTETKTKTDTETDTESVNPPVAPPEGAARADEKSFEAVSGQNKPPP